MNFLFKDLAAFYILVTSATLGWNLAIFYFLFQKNRLKNFLNAKFSGIWKKKFRQ
jgi:hypothetical protein